MKTCLLCHTDNADDAATCVACGEGTFGDPPQQAQPAQEPADSEGAKVTRPSKRSR